MSYMTGNSKSDAPTRDTRTPSRVVDDYWIDAWDLTGTYWKRNGGRVSGRSGKWMIFVNKDEIDKWWEIVKDAVEKGILGDEAKVSTARPNPNSADPRKGVIVVYTYDWTDKDDVMRIREELRKLGIVWKIPYKSDEDTAAGKYKVRGHDKISKYYS
jgi:hypothetical protein